MKMLLEEYQNSLRLTKQMREDAPEEDQKIYGGIITDLEYAVKWLRDKQQPAPKKVRQILFSKAEYIDLFELTSATDLYSGDPFADVDSRVDKERRKKHA